MNLLSILFPRIELHEMSMLDDSTRHHIKQMERHREPQVDSEIVSKPYAVYIHGQAQIRHAVPMKLIATAGHFIGTGTEIIEVEEPHAGN